MSSLIIAFPVFLYVSRLLAGAMRRDPAQRASRARKWLTCLTQEQGIGVASLDAETGRPYGYRILGGNSYELCAEFTRDAAEEGRMPEGDFWTHGAGTQCFRLEASDVEP